MARTKCLKHTTRRDDEFQWNILMSKLDAFAITRALKVTKHLRSFNHSVHAAIT